MPPPPTASGTDFETGEHDLCCDGAGSGPSQRRAAPSIDLETGEVIVRNEVDATLSNAGMRKVPGFNVPREMLPQEPAPTSRCCIDENENYSLFPKVQVLTLQEEIIMGYNTTSHRLFFVLITLLYMFTRHFVAVGLLIEYAMHAWAHMKNGQNNNPGIYYRSPLHIFTSRFCPSCRVVVAMDRVIRMQDERTKLWQLSLRDVARTIT